MSLGAVIGASVSKEVGNKLLENQIEESKEAQDQVSNNFGRPDMKQNFREFYRTLPWDMKQNFNGMVTTNTIDTIDAVVDYEVILELLVIGVALTLFSSLAAMISIQKFSPLTILKERS